MDSFTFEDGNQIRGIVRLTDGEEVSGMIEAKGFAGHATVVCVDSKDKGCCLIFPMHRIDRIVIPDKKPF